MMPLECPIVTGLPSERLEMRSNPRPPFLTSQPTIGSPRSASWRIRRRFASSVFASFSRATVSLPAGWRRVSRHEKHRPAGAFSHTSQLQAHSRFEQVYQVAPSMTT